MAVKLSINNPRRPNWISDGVTESGGLFRGTDIGDLFFNIPAYNGFIFETLSLTKSKSTYKYSHCGD